MNGFIPSYPESNNSDESDEEESNELGSDSVSFGTCGTWSSGLLRYISFSVGVTHVCGYWLFNGGGR